MAQSEYEEIKQIKRVLFQLTKTMLTVVSLMSAQTNAVRILLESKGFISHQEFLDQTEALRELVDDRSLLDALESLSPTDELLEFLKRFEGPIQ